MADKKPLVSSSTASIAEQLQSGDNLDAGSGNVVNVAPPVNGTDAVNLDFLTEAITEVVYVPDSATVNTGDNVVGTVAGVQTLSDGKVLQVGEVGGVPGFEIDFAFSSVESFSRVWVHYQYTHTLPAHTVQLKIWNYTTEEFDVLTQWASVYEAGYRFIEIVVDDTDYIDVSGNALVQIYHLSSGNNGHLINIDYVALAKSVFGSSNEHGALLGLADDDHEQYHNDSRAYAWLSAGHETTYDHGEISTLRTDYNNLFNALYNGSTGMMLYMAGIGGPIDWTNKLFFDGTHLTVAAGSDIKITDNTATYMLYAGVSGAIEATSKMTFDGTNFTITTGSSLIFGDIITIYGGTDKAIQLRSSGNTRGLAAIDLQTYSSVAVADEVASGDYSIAIGSRNEASGAGAIAIGYKSDATGTYSFAMGGGCLSSGFGSYSIGYESQATSEYSFVVGKCGKTDMYGQFTQSANNSSVIGDRQVSSLVAWKNTTDATQTEIFLNGQAGTGTSDMVVPENTIWGFTIVCTARQTNDDFSTARYVIEGIIKRDTGGNVTIVNQSTVYSHEDDSSWAFDVDAYTTGQRLRLRVTGAADNNISWLAHIDIEQMTG